MTTDPEAMSNKNSGRGRGLVAESAPASGPGRGYRTRTQLRPFRRTLPHLPMIAGLILAAVLTVDAQVPQTNSCPSEAEILPCRCTPREDEIQVWCSHSELPSVLNALRSLARLLPSRTVDELILENNAWSSLGGSALAGPTGIRVSRLMLRDNGLETVAATWLAGLEDSLLELFLVEPVLRSLPDESLLQFKRLEAVTLQCGDMQRVPRLAGLPRLRYVHVQSAMLWELPPGHVSALPALEQLHVASSPRLASLDDGALTDLPRLSAINISHSGLTWIHPRALQRLPVLAEITLVGNKLSDAGMVGRALHDLPALATLRLDDNSMEILPAMSFADLPALRELSLAGNKIIELQHGAFQRVPALRTVDLSRNNLRVIHPEAFLHPSGTSLEQLYLQENALDTPDAIRAVLDALPRLRFLDASHNRVVEVGLGALRGHNTLERLHLDHNHIRRVFRDSFSNMPALRELRLSHNHLTNNLDLPHWNLPALKGLDLSFNQFRRCDPRLLANLPSLRRLDLSGNTIVHVDQSSFMRTPALEHVNLSGNALSSLSPVTFRTLHNLFELDVGRNRLTQLVPGLPPAVEYLRMAMNQVTSLPPSTSPDLALPALRLLDLSSNGLKRLPPESLRQMPGLQQLLLGGNALQALETGALSGLSRLERLELRGNRLSSLMPRSLQEQRVLRDLDLRANRLETLPGDVLLETANLENLDVSQNQLAAVEADALRGNRNLQVFRASHNALSSIPTALLTIPSLRILDLSHNRVRDIIPGSLSALTSLQELHLSKNKLRDLRPGAVENLQKLQMLDLDSNEIQVIQSRALYSLPALTRLNLARNRLQVLGDGVLTDVPALMTCELQENQLVQVSRTALAGSPHLLHLNLSYNQLTALENCGLQQLRALEVLDLSHNRVSRLSANTLTSMEWLVELKMDNNRICNIQGGPFNKMPRLRVLSLSNNKMTSFPESTFHRIKHSVSHLDLDGNPLWCSCDLLWLHSWLLETGVSEGPRCADGSFVKELRVSRAECESNANSAQLSPSARQQTPSCDVEVVDLPTVNLPSQVVTTAFQVRASTQAPQQNVAPSPEESEYFYDDYVEYQVDENATAVNNATLLATTANSAPNTVSLQAVTATPVPAVDGTTTSMTVTSNPVGVVSSHYIPGDTPTLYAGTKSKYRPGLDDPKKMPAAPPPGGLTFFGIPLKMPSLNIGGIFGQGRDTDGKVASGRTGDKQMTTVGDGTTGSAISETPGVTTTLGSPGVTTLPPLRQLPPAIPTGSVVRVSGAQSGGFRPIIPGSGGFSPVVNTPARPGSKSEGPQLDIFRQTGPDSRGQSGNKYFPSVDILSTSTSAPVVETENYSFRDSHEERTKQHHSSEEGSVKSTYHRQPGQAGPSLSPGFVTVVSIPENDAIPRLPHREFSRDKDRDTSQESSREKDRSSVRPNSGTHGSATVTRVGPPGHNEQLAATSQTESSIEVEQAVIYNLGELSSRPSSGEAERSSAEVPTTTFLTTSAESGSREWSTPPSSRQRPATALSALLVPGGQLPGASDLQLQAHSRSKVTRVTAAAPLAPGPAPSHDDSTPQTGPIPRSAKGPNYFFSEGSNEDSEKQITRESHNWYYENYNRTNLQPYVGPGSEAYSGNVSAAATSSWTPIMLLIPVLVGIRLS